MSICCNENDLEKLLAHTFAKTINKKINKPNFYEYILASYSDEELESEDKNYEEIDLNKFMLPSKLPSFNLRRNSLSQQKLNKSTFATKIHWIDYEDSNQSDFEFAGREICEPVFTSLLSDLILKDIILNSSFVSYYNSSKPIEDTKALEFTLSVFLNQEKNDPIVKTVVVKDEAIVEDIIGCTLHLCEKDEFELKLDKDINAYHLFTKDSVDNKSPKKELPHLSFAKLIQCSDLILEYQQKEISADIVFHAKTSSSINTSKSYNLRLDNNLKHIITQYLQSRNLKTDGGYDVYLKNNKKFIRNTDISMMLLKDYINEQNKLEFDIIYFDNSKDGETKQQKTNEPTFDYFKHASLIQTLSSVEVNVAIDRDTIEIDPIQSSKSLFSKTKNIQIPIKEVKECATKSAKSSNKKQLRIRYTENEIKKTVSIEASGPDIDEMQKKITEALKSKKSSVISFP